MLISGSSGLDLFDARRWIVDSQVTLAQNIVPTLTRWESTRLKVLILLFRVFWEENGSSLSKWTKDQC